MSVSQYIDLALLKYPENIFTSPIMACAIRRMVGHRRPRYATFVRLFGAHVTECWQYLRERYQCDALPLFSDKLCRFVQIGDTNEAPSSMDDVAYDSATEKTFTAEARRSSLWIMEGLKNIIIQRIKPEKGPNCYHRYLLVAVYEIYKTQTGMHGASEELVKKTMTEAKRHIVKAELQDLHIFSDRCFATNKVQKRRLIPFRKLKQLAASSLPTGFAHDCEAMYPGSEPRFECIGKGKTNTLVARLQAEDTASKSTENHESDESMSDVQYTNSEGDSDDQWLGSADHSSPVQTESDYVSDNGNDTD
jgi:hypothetical protein